MNTRSLVVLLVAVSFAIIIGSSRANAAGWTSLTVDVDGISAVSLDVDDNNVPHISYFARNSDGTFLRHATIENGTWVVEQVSDEPVQRMGTTSIAVDQAGNPHIIYGRLENVSALERITHLTYAYKQSGSWVFEEIEAFPSNSCCADYYNPQLLIDSVGELHLFYNIAEGSYSNRKIKYGQRSNDGTWKLTTIVIGNHLFDVTIDQEDDFHFVYRSIEDGVYSLQYTEFSTISGFAPELIYTATTGPGTLRLSIATSPSGNPYILFSSGSTQYSRQLFLMHLEDGLWSLAPISRKNHTINDLVIDSAGQVHAFSVVQYGSGYSFSARLEHYSQSADGWQEERLNSDNYKTDELSVALDSASNYHVAAMNVFVATNTRSWLSYLKSDSGDITPPSAISDLTAIAGAISGEVDLIWTAPGDDGDSGVGAGYTVRYATAPIETELAWELGTDVEGEPTPQPAGSAERMIISGLTPGKVYYFAVRSVDDKGNWSELSNSPHVVVPGDNVDMDSDGDGLPDEWEREGYYYEGVFVDLPGLGAKVDHKDVFVYFDWLESDFHSHHPEDSLELVVQAFANAPVMNPDGETGINLHIVEGRPIPETDKYVVLGEYNESCEYEWEEFDTIKSGFPRELWQAFHYALFAHYYFGCNGQQYGGLSRHAVGERGGSDFFVALGTYEVLDCPVAVLCPYRIDYQRAGTFMHELGHNLGLHHGGVLLNDDGEVLGPDSLNYKPNHLSVMNYLYQWTGLTRKNEFGIFVDGNMNYSIFDSTMLPPLHESALSEVEGLQASDALSDYGARYLCPDDPVTDPTELQSFWVFGGLQGSVDWNCDGKINDGSVSVDLTRNGSTSDTLYTMNEWEHLVFNGGAIGTEGGFVDFPATTPEVKELSFEEAEALAPVIYTSYLPTLTK